MRNPLTLAIALLAASGSACAIDLGAQTDAATSTFERRLTVNGPVDLDIRTGSGSIDIRRGTDTEVTIVGRVRAGRRWRSSGAEERARAIAADPPIVQDGNSIRIGAFDDPDLGRNVSISYELTVPGNTRVLSRTGSGTHRIDSITGPVEAHTGSGSIRIGDVAEAVTAVSGSGSIAVMGAGGGLSARTGSGSVRAERVRGRAEARSGSGRIAVAFSGAGDGEFTTGSGSIDVAGATGRLTAHAGSGSIRIEGRPTGDWAADSGSGSIRVALPPDAAFDLIARTGSSSIQTNHPIEIRGTVSRRQLEGRVRGGGPRLQLSTSSGGIRVD